MRSCGRTAVSLSALAGLALPAAAQDLSPPTSDQPVLLIQPQRCYDHDAEGNLVCFTSDSQDCQWWPCDYLGTQWDRRFIPMLPINMVGLYVPQGQTSAEPIQFWNKAHQYYGKLLGTNPDPVHLLEYQARMAIEVFNFGGSYGADGSVADPTEQAATEFWVDAAFDMPGQQSQSLFEYMNPYMRTRLCGTCDTNDPWNQRGARGWMEEALRLWSVNAETLPKMPAPVGGVYFDTELVLAGDRLWTETLWDPSLRARPMPDVEPPMPDAEVLETAWATAASSYGWAADPVAAIVNNRLIHQNPNRQYQLWFTHLLERTLNRALKFAAYEPLWKHDWEPNVFGTQSLPGLPIANYGDFKADNRPTQGSELFGWHFARLDAGAAITESRIDWLGNYEGSFDRKDDPGDPGAANYCDECVKHPYPLRPPNQTAVGSWKQDHNRSTTANLHAPVLYLVPFDDHPQSTQPWRTHHSTNLYLPPGHPLRVESQNDATLREARYTLDSMNFSGVTGADMAPWILPPSDVDGILVFGSTYFVDRDYFRRMLMLMRSKEVPRIQVFNMRMHDMVWRDCARMIYDEVYGVTHAAATTVIGTPSPDATMTKITNTTPESSTGAPVTYNIASVTGTDFGKSSTALEVEFHGVPTSNIVGVRLVFECDVRATNDALSWHKTPVSDATFCQEELTGSVYLYNWGTVDNPPGWVEINLSSIEGTQYTFPACIDPDLDLSMRRELTIQFAAYSPAYEFQNLSNATGAVKVLLVHRTESGRPFVSRWDLVQLAGFSTTEFCGAPGSGPTPTVEPPPGEATIGAPTGADINFDGSVTAADLGDFSNAFSDAAPLADYNGDELVTSDDALTFLEDFVEQID